MYAKSTVENVINKNIKSISKIEDGVEESYKISTCQDLYFIKFLKSECFKPRGFIAGAKILPIIKEQSSIPVPKLHKTSFDIQYYNGIPFYITEYIDGHHIKDYESSLSDAYYENVFDDLGYYLSEYNNIDIDCEQFGWAGWFNEKIEPFGGYKKFKDFLIQRINDSSSNIHSDNPMHCIKEDIRQHIKNIKDINFKFNDPCLVNYDIKFQNIIFDKNNKNNPVKSIIDWDNPIIGTPLYNIAKIKRHFIKDYCINPRKNYIKRIINSYCKNSKYNIDKNKIQNSPEMSLCELADYTDVCKHFMNYYGHLNDSELNVCKCYYKNKILDLLREIRTSY